MSSSSYALASFSGNATRKVALNGESETPECESRCPKLWVKGAGASAWSHFASVDAWSALYPSHTALTPAPWGRSLTAL
ncbi:MAG: hypothetical protein ACI9KE_003704 [Polyangiales bacterium]|jgi:hypothetical protein